MFSLSRSPIPRIAAAVAAVCAAFAARAEEFSWQLSGATRHFETGDLDSDSRALDATYYTKPIGDSTGPYALASFLNPTSRVSATASRSDLRDVFDDPTAYTLSGAYVLPGEQWYVGAEYAKSDVDDAPPVTFSDPKGYGVQVGRYLGANTTLELRLGRSEQKSSLTCQPNVQFCIGFPLEIEVTSDSVGFEVFHVRRLRSLTYALQGSVSERDTDVELRPPTAAFGSPSQVDGQPVRQYSVAAELFPTDRLGVRVGYSRPERVSTSTVMTSPPRGSSSRASQSSSRCPDPASTTLRPGSAIPTVPACDSSAGYRRGCMRADRSDGGIVGE
jgi:hypothetical protein